MRAMFIMMLRCGLRISDGGNGVCYGDVQFSTGRDQNEAGGGLRRGWWGGFRIEKLCKVEGLT